MNFNSFFIFDTNEYNASSKMKLITVKNNSYNLKYTINC